MTRTLDDILAVIEPERFTPRCRGVIEGEEARKDTADDILEAYRFLRSRHYSRTMCREVAHALRISIAIHG